MSDTLPKAPVGHAETPRRSSNAHHCPGDVSYLPLSRNPVNARRESALVVGVLGMFGECQGLGEDRRTNEEHRAEDGAEPVHCSTGPTAIGPMKGSTNHYPCSTKKFGCRDRRNSPARGIAAPIRAPRPTPPFSIHLKSHCCRSATLPPARKARKRMPSRMPSRISTAPKRHRGSHAP